MGLTVTAGADKTIDRKSCKTWTVRNGDDTFEVTDKNNNGRIDGGDLINCLSGNKSLSDVQMTEAWAQSCNMGDGMTTQEMIQYNKFQQQQQAALGQNTATSSQTSSKKKGFWGRIGSFFKGVGNVLGAALPFAGLGLMGVGMAKSIGNDPYSGLSYTMAGSGLLTMGTMLNLSKQLNATASAMTAATPSFNTYGVGSIGSMPVVPDTTAMFSALNTSTDGATSLPGVSSLLSGTGGTAAGGNSADLKTSLSKLANGSQLNGLNAENRKWIEENIKEGEDLTDEQLKIAQKIKDKPSTSYKLVGDSSNQISESEAATIDDIKAKYEKLSGDNLAKLLYENYYERMIELSSKDSLTADEALELKGLIVIAVENYNKNKKDIDEAIAAK